MTPTTKPRPWTLQCIIDWLRVREKEGKFFPTSVIEFEQEIDNSALLRRLIEGKHPFPEPPPLSYGNPWYRLMEDGCAESRDVWVGDDKTKETFGFDVLIIDQFPWRILEKASPDSFVITYGTSKDKWKAYVKTMLADTSSPTFANWKIEFIG